METRKSNSRPSEQEEAHQHLGTEPDMAAPRRLAGLFGKCFGCFGEFSGRQVIAGTGGVISTLIPIIKLLSFLSEL